MADQTCSLGNYEVELLGVEQKVKGTATGQQTTVPWLFTQDDVETWAYDSRTFASEDCDALIGLANSFKKNIGTIGDGCADIAYRHSSVCWIPPINDATWVYEKLTEIVLDLNNRFFKFNLTGFVEPLQFTEYIAPTGKYGQHVDKIYKSVTRKLSCVVQLTDPSEYEGGELVLYTDHKGIKVPRQKGFVAVFPSYVLHEVTPVTKGVRHTLVGWVHGENFK